MNHQDDDKQPTRQGLQHNAIHSQAEYHRGAHKRDRCGVPDRDRHQGPQRLRPIARTQAPGSGPDPAACRVQPVKGAYPCHGQPRPKA